jgi:hypothetical protein
MLRLLCIVLSLFLYLQLAVADPALTVLRVSRHSKSSSLVLTKSVLSALLVRRGRFIARQGSGGCPSGYRKEFTRQILRYTLLIRRRAMYQLPGRMCPYWQLLCKLA